MRVKRLVLCMMLSLALVVTFIPVISFAYVEYYTFDEDDNVNYIEDEDAPWTISQQGGKDVFYISEGETVNLTIIPPTNGSQLNLTYTWYYGSPNEEELTKINGATSTSLQVDSIGFYLCQVSDTEGNYADAVFNVYKDLEDNEFTDFEDIVDDAVPISLGDKKTVNTETMFAFTPKVSGTYAFLSYYDSNADPVGRVFDAEGNFIDYGDDESNSDFYIEFEAEAGKTYYLQTMNYYNETVVFGVRLVEAAHKWTHFATPGGYLVNGIAYDKCDICGTIANQNVVPGWATSYVKGLKVAKGKGKITVKWKKQSKKNLKKFNGYQIRYSTSPDMSGAKYTTAGKKSKSKKIGKLAKKTKYYVQVRTYTTTGAGTFYSGWSTKTVKTK